MQLIRKRRHLLLYITITLTLLCIISTILFRQGLLSLVINKPVSSPISIRVPAPPKSNTLGKFSDEFGTLQRWSDAATWNGKKPVDGDSVVIPSGRSILLDVNTPNLKSMTIEGNLVFDEQDLHLTANWIMVHGVLEIGTEQHPFQHKATITLTGMPTNEDNMGMGSKFLGAMGSGRLELHGQPRISWTHLNATASPGATTLTLDQAIDWQPGDQVVLAPSNVKVQQTENLTLQNSNGTQITLSQPLKYLHWGTIQTIDNRSLDERAEIGLLSHNIVIEGDDSTATTGFGGQIVLMHGATGHIENIETRSMGQRGRLGRYPLHFHLMGDVTGSYVKNASIHDTYNRCLTVHATNKLLVQGNVAYHARGNCFYLEDGNEEFNDFEQNLGVDIYPVLPGDELLTEGYKASDLYLSPDRLPSVYWISNPNNTFVGNVAAGSDHGSGFHFSIPEHPKRTSFDANFWPQKEPFGVFRGNVAHSNFAYNEAEEDYGGGGTGIFFGSTLNQGLLEDVTSYMNSKYCLEAYNVHIVKAHIDDCRWGDVAIGNGLLEDSLVVGVSDNTGGMVELGDGGMEIRVGAFLPFDQSPMSIKNVTFANFTRWKSSAAVGWNGHFWLNMPASQSQGVHLVNSRAIYYPSIDPNKSEATVATFYDLDGSLTGTGKATAVVYNNPLQVDGNCSAHPEANAMYCPGNYHYARNVLELSNPLPLVRNDGATSNMGSINQAIGTTFLTNTSYSIHLNNPAPANFRMFLSKMEPDNWVRFSLNTGYGKPFVYPDADNRSHPLTEAQSLADLDASQGNMFYFDASTNTVYFKFIPTITAITFCQHEKCAG